MAKREVAGFDAYTKAILRAVTPITTRLASSPSFRESIFADLSGVPRSTRAVRPNLRRDEEVAIRLFEGITEIATALYRLETIAQLTRYAPPKRWKVDAAEFLQVMTELYLGEVYILKERCDAHGVTVLRLYSKDERHASIKSMIKALGEATADAFKEILNVRGAHVHEQRYTNFVLGRANLTSLLATGEATGGGAPFKSINAEALRRGMSR